MTQTFYTTAEAAVLLGVSLATTKRLIKNGELPTVKVHLKPGLAPRRRVSDTDLKAFIEARSQVAS